MVKAVLFDMDGTLFDTEKVYQLVREEMSLARGVTLDLDFKKGLVGTPSREIMQKFNALWGTNEDIETLFEEETRRMREHYAQPVDSMPGLDEIFAFLKERGIRKCLGTSTPGSLVRYLLAQQGMLEEFEYIVTGDMVEHNKPSPDIYEKCVELLEISPEDCLVIEDSPAGAEAGAAAGCKVCAIPNNLTIDRDFSSADIVALALNDPRLLAYIRGE